MFIFLFVLWVILNGRLTVEIAVAGVIICAVLYLFLHKFMGYKVQQDIIIAKAFPRIISYLFYLVIEVIKANLEVAKAILRFDTDPEPVMVKFRTNIKTATGRTLLANSITLTPGTFTIDLEDGEFTVHALDRAYAEGLDQCDFITGINKLEEVLEKEEKHMFDEIPVLADVCQGFLIIVFGILVIMFLLSLLRLVMGPSVADRVLAVNMLGGMVISAVAVLALILNETYLFDISLIYALLSFLAAIVLAQIYIGVYRERNAREERKLEEKAGKEDAANGCS